MRRRSFLVRALSFFLLYGLAHATPAVVLFEDNFGAETPGLNASLSKWNILDGSVDVLQAFPGISCYSAGNGICLDLDGSTSDAVTMVSKQTFNLFNGGSYSLSYVFSGNQRAGTASDSWSIGVADAATNMVFASINWVDVAYDLPFQVWDQLLPIGSPVPIRLYISHAGGDNVGVILDQVAFKCEGTCSGSVPEPAVLALLSIGLAGIGFARKRIAP